MGSLIIDRVPEMNFPLMVVCFAGWPDAAESATGGVRYLVEKLGANKFAEIDPEEFYDFSVVRPNVELDSDGNRSITWPSNDFYYCPADGNSPGVILYIGTEPNLKWRTFLENLMSLTDRFNVELVVSLGALLDAVPHTRDTLITGRASSSELLKQLELLGLRNSTYQGPTGIHTAFMDACIKGNLPHVSIWGHVPHYVTSSPNPKVSHALLDVLTGFVDLSVDLDDMKEAGRKFVNEVSQVIDKQVDVKSYVNRLEKRYDDVQIPSGDVPSHDLMLEELEDFLKSQRPNSEENNVS